MNGADSFNDGDMKSDSDGFTSSADFSNSDDSFNSGSAAKRSTGGFLVLGLVVVVAGGSLFVMRKLSAGRNLASADIKLDYPIGADGSLQDGGNEHIKVLDDLASIDSSVQVPLESIEKKNPFVLGDGEVIEAANIDDPEARRLAELQARLAKVQAEFNKLELNSVLGGSTPIARISGEAVRVGDKIGDYFTVIAIHGRSVELSAEGEIYTLFME